MNPTLILGWLRAHWRYVALGLAVLLFLLIAGNFTLTRRVRAESYSLGTYPGERLYTYYYKYPVLLVSPGKNTNLLKSIAAGRRVIDIDSREVQKYCAKNYEVGIGYRQATIELYRQKICEEGLEFGEVMDLPPEELEPFAPEIISVNAFQSFLAGYDQLQCDALDREQYYPVDESGRPARLRDNVLWLGNADNDDSIGFVEKTTCEESAPDGQARCEKLLLRNAILENELKKYPRLRETILKNSVQSLDGYVRLFCDS